MMMAAPHRSLLGIARPPPGIFCKSYQCHSMACLDRKGLEFGDKIILPQAAFQEAHRLRLKLPLLFKLVNSNIKTRRVTSTAASPYQFCGVLEFSAPDDQVFLPYWLMQSLLLAEGERVELRSIQRPPPGCFVRFKPHDNAFLDLAARQGPKALMEGALRRYSVLFEGATILVQHEGENFYLDVAEVRTFANSPIILSGDANAPPENGSDAGGEGKRVRLVCLLGDLDLEVEFCPAHAPMPQVDPSGGQPLDRCEEHHRGNLLREHPPGVETARALNWQGSHTSMDEGTAPPGRFPPRSASTSSRYAVSESPMTTTAGSSAFNIATGRDGDQAGGLGGALPLPAPARVMKACGAHGWVSALKSVRSESGQLGMKPPVPPSFRASSKTFRCQAFSGKGMSLLGGSTDSPSHSGRNKRSAGAEHNNERPTNNSQEASGCKAEAEEDGRLTEAGGSLYSAGRVLVGRGEDDIAEDRKNSIEPPSAWGVMAEGDKGGRVLGEGSLAAAGTVSSNEGASVAEAAPRPAGPVESGYMVADAVPTGAAMVACRSCGKVVPVSNLRLHELRCRHPRAVVGGQQAPPRRPAAEPCAATGQPLSGGPGRPVEVGVSQVQIEHADSTRGAAAPSSGFSCAYCGLTFSAADHAGEHEEICGARTERCGRCCGHVPLRDVEYHCRPGGVCDAAIAAAEQQERKMMAVGVDGRLGLGANGRGGGGGVMGGKFDALLAEAVRSSKAASTALAEARAENHARLAETAETVLRQTGRRAPSRSLPERVEIGAEAEAVAYGSQNFERYSGGSGLPPSRGRGHGSRTDSWDTCADPSRRGVGTRGARPDSLNVAVFVPSSREAEQVVQCGGVVPISPRTEPATPSNSDGGSGNSGNSGNSGSSNGSISSNRPSLCDERSPRRPGEAVCGDLDGGRAWTCERCTLINLCGPESCEACGSERPSAGKCVAVGGGTPPETRPSEHVRLLTAAPETARLAPPTPAGTASIPTEADLLHRQGFESLGAEAGAAAVLAAEDDEGKEEGPRAPMSGSSLRSQENIRPGGEVWAARATVPPDPCPPPGKARPLKQRRNRRASDGLPVAPLLSVLPAVETASSDTSEEHSRFSASAPQPRRTGGDPGGADARLAPPRQARNTAPVMSLGLPAAVESRLLEGRVAAAAVEADRPRARSLRRSTARLAPAEIHRPQHRRAQLVAGPAGTRVLQQPQQQRQHVGRIAPLARRKGKVNKRTGRRLMGPPRRLGGVHRPPQQRYPNPSLPAFSSPHPVYPGAATPPGRPSPLGPTLERRVRSGQNQNGESRTSVVGLAPDSGRCSPPGGTPPASDVSLSILGRRQGCGDRSRAGVMLSGVRAGGAGTGKVSLPAPTGNSRIGDAPTLGQSGGGGGGDGDSDGGVGVGCRHGGVERRAGVGVAPFKLRRRVTDSRLLGPLLVG